MKRVLVIDLSDGETTRPVSFLGQSVELRVIGCGGDPDRARRLIAEHDGRVDAICLDGLPARLRLGAHSVPHVAGAGLPAVAGQTPVVDGGGVRSGLERWGVTLADRAQPGLFAEKRILMVPGLNHGGLAQALARHSPDLRYADPVIYFALPDFPGVGSRMTLDQAAPPTLERLREYPFRRLAPQPVNGATQRGVIDIHSANGHSPWPRARTPFEWADVLAGDIGAIRRYAPARLDHKTVVVEHASPSDLDDLRQRGVSIVVTLMPALDGDPTGDPALGAWSAAVLEGVLAALRPDTALPLTEDTYLDLIADLEWRPAVRYLRPDEQGINRFAFVIHPLSVRFIHQHRWFRWTQALPDELVEAVSAFLPPIYLSRITGALSPATGQKVEGVLLSLGATPRQMMARGERFTYDRLNRAARMAERLGARIMGLGAFTSVVGDAGITVAHEADIAITSGNSLTVAATLEAAKQAVLKMGAADLTRGKAMVIGATGSIGSVCARLLAQAIGDVVLVSIEPDKLIELKRRILAETPGARVAIATRADEALGDCDLVVTATSAFGQRVINLGQCKPGAVICDVARPPDINPAEAALRPDVLVIESGEVLIPGDIDFGYDIGLPPKTSYACLAETCLLAMEGRFEDYTLGRNIEMERVKEIYRLFKKHDFRLAGLRSFGEFITDSDVAQKRTLAEGLRGDPTAFTRIRGEATARIAALPAMAKGVSARGRDAANGLKKWAWLGLAGLGLAGGLYLLRPRRRA
jgi:predicted amino acid dehydrogenase